MLSHDTLQINSSRASRCIEGSSPGVQECSDPSIATDDDDGDDNDHDDI